MADQKADKDYTDAELTKMFRDSVKRAPDYIRKHIDVNRIRAVNASGQNPADYASADQKEAVNNKDAIADVRDGSRTVVHIYRPSEFAKDPDQISGHEATHFIYNGLPDDIKNKMAPVNPQDPYGYGGNAGIVADAKAGKTIESLSPEQQATLVQYSIAFDKFADQPTTSGGTGSGVPTAAQQDWAKNRTAYDHYTQQIANWPQKPYSDDTEPIVRDDDPRLKIDVNLRPDLPSAGTIPPAAVTPVSNVSTGSFQAGMLFGPEDSAPGENLFNAGMAAASSTPPPQPAAAPASASASTNIFDQGLGSSSAAAAPAQTANPTSFPSVQSNALSQNLFDLGLGQTNGPATPQNPENGQHSNPSEGLIDQGKDTLKKAWNWANTPLTESLGGLADSRAGAGGVERGLEKIASGFTSPLSIALTLGTFGTAGFIESAGASVLRDVAGMSAAEIADVAKGSEAAAEAIKSGLPITEAVQNAGVDPNLWKKGVDALYAAGLKEGDLTGGNAAERGASLMFRKFALSPAKAQVAAKTMQAAVNAGFTYQAVQQAAQMSPRALDALKEGDYDHFAEYATEALAGAAFGAAGASHAIHSAGELAEPLLENKLRPSDETRKFSNLFDALDGQRQQANEQARLLQESTMKALGYSDPKSPFTGKGTSDVQMLRLNQLFHGITLGFDKDLAAEHYNAIAEAAGRPDRLSTQNSENGQHPTFGKEVVRYDNAGADLTSGKPQGIYTSLLENGHGSPHTDVGNTKFVGRANGKNVLDIIPATIEHPRFGSLGKGEVDAGVGALRQLTTPEEFEQFRKMSKPELVQYMNENHPGPDYNKFYDSYELLGALGANKARQAGYDALYRPDSQIPKMDPEYREQMKDHVKDFTEYVGLTPHSIKFGEPNPALPANLRDLIANSDLKNKPADYIDHLLDVYKGVHEGFNDNEMAVAKDLRDKLQQGFMDANANGLIKNHIENYMQRRWEKPNPTANKIISDAGSGRFTTNVSAAQQRVFHSELEPILKGYQLRSENPITLTSQWLADSYKAIANRKLLSSVLDRSLRASDGRPAVVLLGNGQVLEGSDGQNAATMIRPDSVRNIKIADPEIQNLKATGALDRYLDDQTILDLTPKVHPDTIPAFIDRLEKIATSRNAQYDAQGNNVLRQQIDVLKDIQSGKRPMSDLSLINDAQKPVYVWRPQDYIHLDQPSMRKWNFVVHDPSGDPVLVKSDLAVHPEYADYLKTRLGLDESALQKWGPTRALLKGGGEAKKLLLSFSPFHMMQEALRGVMLGVNPLHLTDRTIAEDPILQKMVEHRLTLEPDHKGLQEESEGVAGHSKLLDKLPFGIGKAMDWYQDFLFKKYIPSLKAEAAVKMFNEYRDAHPDWTDDRVAEVASAHVNDTFGGINYKAMGRSVATQDWARLLTLAPDWLEAELRSGVRLFGGDGNIARSQVAKMALGLWGVARVLNYVTTGNFHNEAPFGLAVKNKDGKETIFSVRTLPTDLLHAATDPVGFMKGRFSPALRAGQEILSSRDQFGRKLSPGDMGVDLLRNFAPIPFQAAGQALSGNGPEVGNIGQLVKAGGGTATVYRTEAQKLAAQIASDHSESGPVDPALLHRHRVIMGFEDKVRDGEMGLPDVYKMVVSGDLSQSDAKKIAENVKNTKGMNADMAGLFTRASRAPAPDFLKIWDASTPHEKTVLTPLLLKNRKAYISKAMKDETPQERQRDPVLHRFMSMFPQAAPF